MHFMICWSSPVHYFDIGGPYQKVVWQQSSTEADVALSKTITEVLGGCVQETCTLVLMGEFVLHEAIIRALSVK